jgi:hypothetical protein
VTRWLPQQKNFGYFLLPTSSLLAFTNLSKKASFCKPCDAFFSAYRNCSRLVLAQDTKASSVAQRSRDIFRYTSALETVATAPLHSLSDEIRKLR